VVAAVELLEGRREQQIAVLGAVWRLMLQQPPGPGQPAAALGQLAPAEQQEAEPEGAAGGPAVVALRAWTCSARWRAAMASATWPAR
jgi:hypothetical protein